MFQEFSILPGKRMLTKFFPLVAKISSIVDIMNYKFKKNNVKEITIGIGISYGKALVLKSGYKGKRM